MQNTKPATVWISGVKPELGDLTTSKSINRSGRSRRVWEACPSCGTERWIKLNTSGVLCKSCALRQHSFGESNRRWNPTRKTVTKSGIRVYIGPDHPYFCMAHRCAAGFAILEHRLIMAEILGRPLQVGEVVHHLDGDNTNNDPNNLMLLPSQAHHSSYTLLQTRVKQLETVLEQVKTRIILLEVENELLKSRVSNMRCGNPDLAGEDNSPGKSRDFTLPTLFEEQGKEKVHPQGRTLGNGA